MSRPYYKKTFENRDETIKIMQTSSVKPDLEFNKINNEEHLKYTPITDLKNGNKDPKKIKMNWNNIIGYVSIKHLLEATLKNKNRKKTHLLIAGSPGTSKTVFLQTIEINLKAQGYNVHYLDATTLTSSGVIEYLFNQDIEYLLLDELDKLDKDHQNTFLNLCEVGLLQETKHKKIRKKDMKNTIIIATANYLEKLIKPLKTRFLILEIPKYTEKEFYDIGVQLLQKDPYLKSKDIAYYIVDQIWKIYKVKRQEDPNLRQAVQVALLTDNTKESIDPILRGISDYSKQVEVEK